MKASFASLTLIVLLTATGTTTALAHQDYSEGAMYHNLSHAALAAGQTSAHQQAPRGDIDYSEAALYHNLSRVASSVGQPSVREQALLGYAVSGAADRVVAIDGTTPYLNVTRFETVQINVGGKSVTWRFDTFGTPSFTLDKIVPGAGNVTVYVAPSLSDRGS